MNIPRWVMGAAHGDARGGKAPATRKIFGRLDGPLGQPVGFSQIVLAPSERRASMVPVRLIFLLVIRMSDNSMQ
jgi:hypothetical protein